MPLFTVYRNVGAETTKDDVDAASFRAIVCMFEYPGMRWLESYWDRERGQLICIYEADNAQQIFDHAERSKIPCDEVRPAVVIRPGDYVDAAAMPVTSTT